MRRATLLVSLLVQVILFSFESYLNYLREIFEWRVWNRIRIIPILNTYDASQFRQSLLFRYEKESSESFAMNTNTLTSGSEVKKHISLKTVFGYNATRRTSFRSWFVVYQRVLPPVFPHQHPWHLQGRKLIILRLPQPLLLHQPQLCQATAWLDKHGETYVG